MTTAVVVTYDSARWIDACLVALEGAGVPAIVVDNASRDDTLARVRASHPGTRVVARERNGGYAVAVNAGARLAPDDDILVVNPDVVVTPGAVAALEAYLRAEPAVGIVVPRLVYPDGTIQESIRAFPSPLALLARRSPFGRTGPGRRILADFLLADETPTTARPIPWAIGAAMLVRRAAIRAVGGMDERIFLYGEDTDWCHRMWSAGWAVHIEPAAVMTHHYLRHSRRTLDVRSAATRHHWVSLAKLFGLHPGLLVGRGPRRAEAAIRAWKAGSAPGAAPPPPPSVGAPPAAS
jgi:hypothetical protein